jgi:hypothetical protein
MGTYSTVYGRVALTEFCTLQQSHTLYEDRDPHTTTDIRFHPRLALPP